MARRWCDHGAYGLLAVAAPVPANWAVPQEGDGLAQNPSTGVGTAYIAFSAVPTLGTGGTPSITVCGVSFTALSTLTAAASASAAADAMAALINASTTTVAAAVSSSTPKLSDLVYARGPTNGAPAGQCQIMMRVGAPALDYANNVNCCITSSLVNNISSTTAQQQFVGGVSGCYGTLISLGAGTSANPAVAPSSVSMFKSGFGVGAYGLWGTTQRPLAGLPQPGDFVRIRAGKKLDSFATGMNVQVTNAGAPSNPVIYEIDWGSNTVNGAQGAWPQDGANPVLQVLPRYDSGGSGSYTFSSPSIIRGQKYADGTNSLQFCAYGNGNNSSTMMNLSFGGQGRVENTTWDAYTYNGGANPGPNTISPNGSSVDTTLSTGGITVSNSYNQVFNAKMTYAGCKFMHRNVQGNFLYVSNGNFYSILFDSCDFSNKGATQAHPGIFYISSAIALIQLISPRFLDFVGPSKLAGYFNPGNNQCMLLLRDPQFGNSADLTKATVTSRGPYAFNQSATGTDWQAQQVAFTMTGGQQDFGLDSKLGFLDWNSTAGYPTLNARQKDGVTPMSWRFIPTTLAANISVLNPYEFPRMWKYNTLGQGTATITAEVLVDDNLMTAGWGQKDLWFMVDYYGADGNRYVEDCFMPGASGFTASTAAWTGTYDGNNKLTQVSGGPFGRYKLSLQLAHAIAANSEFGLTFRCAGIGANANQAIFIDPSVTVAVV